jgi:hypothetical protein
MEYKIGQVIEKYGSIYVVENIYQLTDKEMKKHNLIHKNRIRLKKIEGVNGSNVEDYALVDYN